MLPTEPASLQFSMEIYCYGFPVNRTVCSGSVIGSGLCFDLLVSPKAGGLMQGGASEWGGVGGVGVSIRPRGRGRREGMVG